MARAFFFGDRPPGSAHLFGTVTHVSPSAKPAFAVLMCHAFSEERQKSYRSTYLFARQLASVGIPSMRFDYFGTGDSRGNLSDVTLHSMTDDTVEACHEIRERFQVDSIVLLGVRLGAAVATRAANRLGDIDRMIFWNPVIEGRRFLRDLTRTEAMINLARKKRPSAEQKVDVTGIEVDADTLSETMASQLKELDLASETQFASEFLVTGRKSDKIETRQIENLVGSLAARDKRVCCWTGEEREFWSSRSMYDAFYPRLTFETSIEWLTKQRNT
ncbi:MAG: alpha/beta hydrolase [Woeseiaceae bacterium]|nr:alpha/beta hydrolase [Woeseiaceae bacterium]